MRTSNVAKSKLILDNFYGLPILRKTANLNENNGLSFASARRSCNALRGAQIFGAKRLQP